MLLIISLHYNILNSLTIFAPTNQLCMRKFMKWTGYIILVIAILIIGIVGYIKFSKPDVGKAPDLKVEITPQRVERGKYLANSVTLCMDCHSTRDWTLYSAPPVAGTEGVGGEKFDQTMGFPGVFYSRNITPYRLKNWTDGELYRTITTGVDKNGEPLMPVMPYHNYGKMDTEDIYSIIAYVRSLPEVKKDVPSSAPDFPFSVIMRLIPKKAEPQKLPAESDTLAYGRYLVNAAGCAECHTKFEKGDFVKGTEYGGGRQFQMPGGVLTTPNISPDMETGIGSWTKDMFVSRFKAYTDSSFVPPHVDPAKDFMTIMPWMMYGKMKESDLSAIYAYLRTVDKRSNKVVKWQPGVKI